MTDKETAAWFEFAKQWARDFARRKNLLRKDPDEIESRAGVALTYAVQQYVEPAAFKKRLCGIIARQLYEAARAAGRVQEREASSVNFDALSRTEVFRPSALPPGRRKRKGRE